MSRRTTYSGKKTAEQFAKRRATSAQSRKRGLPLNLTDDFSSEQEQPIRKRTSKRSRTVCSLSESDEPCAKRSRANDDGRNKQSVYYDSDENSDVHDNVLRKTDNPNVFEFNGKLYQRIKQYTRHKAGRRKGSDSCEELWNYIDYSSDEDSDVVEVRAHYRLLPEQKNDGYGIKNEKYESSDSDSELSSTLKEINERYKKSDDEYVPSSSEDESSDDEPDYSDYDEQELSE